MTPRLRRRPGRPPLTPGDVPARVHVSIPSHTYDRAVTRANQEGVSVSALLRRGLVRVLTDTGKG